MGITIGMLAVFGLTGLLIYMRRRQKTTSEIPRNSEVPLSSYVPPTPGISEANDPKIRKANFITSDDLGGNGRSNARSARQIGTTPDSGVSPPIDDQTMMMTPRHLFVSQESPIQEMISTAGGIISPGSPSPMYTESHGMENEHMLRFVFYQNTSETRIRIETLLT